MAPGRTRPGALRARSARAPRALRSARLARARAPELRSRDPAPWKNLIAGARRLPCWGPGTGVPGTSVWRRGPAVSSWLTLGVWGVSWPFASRFASRLVWCSAKLIKFLGQLAGSGLQRDAAGLLAKLHLHRAKSADALTLYVERSRFFFMGGLLSPRREYRGNTAATCVFRVTALGYTMCTLHGHPHRLHPLGKRGVTHQIPTSFRASSSECDLGKKA